MAHREEGEVGKDHLMQSMGGCGKDFRPENLNQGESWQNVHFNEAFGLLCGNGYQGTERTPWWVKSGGWPGLGGWSLSLERSDQILGIFKRILELKKS